MTIPGRLPISPAAAGPDPKPEERPEPRVKGRACGERYSTDLTVLHHPILRTIAVAVLMLEFFGGMYGSVVVLYMSRGLGFDPAVLTPIWAVGGVSSFVGAMLAGRVTRALGVGPTMIGCLLMSTIGALFIPLAEGATLVSAGLLIAAQLTSDPANTAYEINRVSLLLSVAPPQVLGRVNASTRFVGLGATLLGTLLGGLLGERLGLRSTLFLAAGGALLPAAWLFLSPVRRLRAAV
ncbi:MAG: MFS transporter [Chloroflexia bacterium]